MIADSISGLISLASSTEDEMSKGAQAIINSKAEMSKLLKVSRTRALLMAGNWNSRVFPSVGSCTC